MPLHEHIEQLADEAPDQVVLTAGQDRMTARKLDRSADRIASALHERGIGRGDRVAVALPRDITLVPALLGVLKAGAAYVPIDPHLPSARIAAMLEDSAASHVIVHDAAGGHPPYAALSSTDPTGLPARRDRLRVDVAASDLAYIIYTSGTTGRPKGVAVEHRSLDNLVRGWAAAVPFPVGATMSSLATVAFDIFVAETVLPMVYGLRVALATDSDVAGPDAIADFLERERVDVMQVTPSRLAWILADMRGREALGWVRLLVVGGEAFPPPLLSAVRRVTDALIYNVYGPTEATVWTSAKRLASDAPITIGAPLRGVEYHLDEGAAAEPGVGELCISGAALARGYWNDAERTYERFGAGGSCYRTGDLARRVVEDEFQVLGRVDEQVKIDGYRVELGEIETVLAEAPGVSAVVVVPMDGGATRTLAGWVTPESVDVSAVWERAATRLPRYMMPSTLVAAPAIPLSPAGKADRAAVGTQLRELVVATTPPDPVEYIAAAIGQWVGGPVELDGGSLLELGLGSLATARLAAELECRYRTRLELSDIISARSVRAVAELVRERMDEPAP